MSRLKYYLIFYFSAGFFLSCQTSDESIPLQQLEEDNPLHEVHFMDYYESLMETDQLFEQQNRYHKSLEGLLENLKDVNIIKDEVVRIRNGESFTYTFKLSSEKTDRFYNLAISFNDSFEPPQIHVIEYFPTPDWKRGMAFTGEFSIFSYKDFLENKKPLFDSSTEKSTQKSSGGCVTGVNTSWECNLGNPHAPDDPACTAGTSWTYSIS